MEANIVEMNETHSSNFGDPPATVRGCRTTSQGKGIIVFHISKM
jgi:hypothetical protein